MACSMLTGVINAMSCDMSNKLSSHFKSLEAHFTPAEARVQQRITSLRFAIR